MKNSKTPLINTNLRWFMLAMILANIAGTMAYSMLSLYMIDLGASVGQVGMVFTIASLVPLVLQIFAGWFSDTVGRLRAIAIGSAISVLGYVIFLFSPSWEWLLLGLCVEFISNAFVGPSYSAYIAEQSEEAVRGKVYGITNGVYRVVWVVGPVLAGVLAYRLNFRVMLGVAFVLYALATIVRVWMGFSRPFKPTRAPEKPTLSGLQTQLKSMFKLLLAGGILTWLWISDGISDTTSNLTYELFPIYMADIGRLTVEQIGLMGSLWGTASIGGSFLGGWLTDRRSEREVIVAGFFLHTAGLVVTILSRSPWGFVTARLLGGLGVGMLLPAYDTLISKVVPEDKRGLAFGFFGTSLGIISLPMPWIGAQLWERISPQTPFWVTAAACLLVIPIVWFKFILPKGEKSATTSPAAE